MRKNSLPIAIVLAVVILPLFIWFLIKPDSDVSHTKIHSDLKDADEPDHGSEISKNGLSKIERIHPYEEALESDDSSEPKETIESTSTTLVYLAGTITVMDGNGIEHVEEDGSFKLISWREHFGEIDRIKVIRGKWYAKVPHDVMLGVDDINLGNRPAVLEGKKKFPIPENGFLALRAHWPTIPEVILHVIASDSGIELNSVELLCSIDCIYDYPHGGKTEEIHYDTKSPIILSETYSESAFLRYGREKFFARSPGYAWGSIFIDFHAGGEYTLDLKPGGNLIIDVDGYKHDKRVFLSVWKIGEENPEFEVGIKRNGQLELDSLEEGTYHVRVETGKRLPGETVRLGEGEAYVAAGKCSFLSLMLRPPPEDHVPEIAKVPLKGIIVIPVEWGQKDFEFSLDLHDVPPGCDRVHRNFARSKYARDELIPINGSENVFHWDAGLVPPGLYEVYVATFRYLTSLNVGFNGMTNAVIEVPPITQIAIRFIDFDSGLDADIERFYCNVYFPDGRNISYTKGGSERNEKSGLFEFYIPLGEKLTVRVETQKYSSIPVEGVTYTIVPGLNIYSFDVRKTCGFILIFKEKGNIIADSKWFEQSDIVWKINKELPIIENLSRVDRYLEGYRFTLRQSGSFMVRIPSINGYQPIPEQKILVKPGEFTQHIIEIQRAP